MEHRPSRFGVRWSTARPCLGLPFILSDVESDSKAKFMCNICTRVYFCTLGVNLHPGCMLSHENGVLRKYCRVQNYTGCKFAPTFQVKQIELHPDVFLHPCVFCAYERKTLSCYTAPFSTTTSPVQKYTAIPFRIVPSRDLQHHILPHRLQ